MTREQMTDIIRWVVGIFATTIATWAAAQGYASKETVIGLLNSETVIGFIVTIGMIVWGWIGRTPTNLVLSAAKLTEVKEIAMTSSELMRSVVAAKPEAKIVPMKMAA